MANRIDFSNSIENLDENNILSLFDPVMTLYGIVGTLSNVNISNVSSSKVASFDITFEADDGVINNIISQYNMQRINVLGSMTTIECSKNSSSQLHLNFIKEED